MIWKVGSPPPPQPNTNHPPPQKKKFGVGWVKLVIFSEGGGIRKESRIIQVSGVDSRMDGLISEFKFSGSEHEMVGGRGRWLRGGMVGGGDG